MHVQYPTVQKLAPQLKSIGFSETVCTLPLITVVQNIKDTHGQDLYDTHLNGKSPDQSGAIIQSLLTHNLLRPKTTNDILASEEFETTIKMIKIDPSKLPHGSKPWELMAIGNKHGMKVCEYVFKTGIDIKLGDFPDDFPDIRPGHNQYPDRSERFTNIPMIKVERVLDLQNAQFFNSFDTVYFANRSTRLFSTIFNGDLCNAQKDPDNEYTRGKPGCWWLVQSKFLKTAGMPITTPLDKDTILQVINPFLISYTTIFHDSFSQILWTHYHKVADWNKQYCDAVPMNSPAKKHRPDRP